MQNKEKKTISCFCCSPTDFKLAKSSLTILVSLRSLYVPSRILISVTHQRELVTHQRFTFAHAHTRTLINHIFLFVFPGELIEMVLFIYVNAVSQTCVWKIDS